ncbi:hypothetical protein GLOIN_2v1472086 [Rhizophagus irregularis DAOM 181602=DAOM 197198]|uniref:Uncharacterized protein n=1 Tax=Rhizophagus irregularis (strain DAOM 181602 / DAOM 197198 / MUCL 43194) TaxID=747089 RepID=A0A2P4QQD0_RHIID|nr:hypothetical protein GLOIN_2v1472086 [Rhizophagus irregularis DAOM 181602=DAOM 197198]POG79857.1 hypothetical protein GLOIN_2v1472086 [Rhizophagus irregularis DAOM 181602=DAOM 197198]|eukprot:XP_025186723.1 hypothetical protein GLOIN_2v1472086 [Rhizophagus irregularis DAOM 181602=DAOM 197198]
MNRLSKVFKPLKISSKDALYSKVYDFLVDDFNDQKINKISKISSIFKASNKSSSKVFETLKISSKNDIQNDHEKETIQQMKESVNGVLQPNAMLTINKAVAQQAIVAFHVQEVSKLLSRNTFDLDEIFNEDPPKPIYFEDSDILIVSLVYSTLPSRFLKTEIEDIKVRTDNVGNIICLSFYSASNRIAEELTLEEKENHKKKSKEKSERLLNLSKSIIHEYNM